jgi:hypothetical protein
MIAVYAALFFIGLVFTSGTSILQALAVRRQQKESPHHPVMKLRQRGHE